MIGSGVDLPGLFVSPEVYSTCTRIVAWFRRASVEKAADVPARGGLILDSIHASTAVAATTIRQVYDESMLALNADEPSPDEPRLEIRHHKPKHAEGFFEVVEVRGTGHEAVRIDTHADIDEAMDAYPKAKIHPSASAAAMLMTIGRGPRRAYYPPDAAMKTKRQKAEAKRRVA